jgi:hypothetical protein
MKVKVRPVGGNGLWPATRLLDGLWDCPAFYDYDDTITVWNGFFTPEPLPRD